MKRIIITIVSLLILIYDISCSKIPDTVPISCSGIAPAQDSAVLLAFAQGHDIGPVVADTSWLYYQIVNQGSGATPTGTSKITVNYVGRFMNGNYFDSTTSPLTFELDSLIKGWQYGLPKIQAGGRIKLLVPSALAFGCVGTAIIPPNADLYFDVNLISVK